MTDERSSVVAYAVASARLSDPFASRADVLASLGLDEASWAHHCASWRAELVRRDELGDRSLADTFAHAFAAEKSRLTAARRAPPAEDPSRGVARTSRAPDPQESLDRTGFAHAALEPALPFAGSRQPPPLSEVTVLPRAGDIDTTAVLDDNDPLGMTLPFDDD